MIAMAITSQPQKAGFPLTFELPRQRMPKPSWVKVSQIRTLSVDKMGKRIGLLSPEDLNHIVDGLIELIG